MDVEQLRTSPHVVSPLHGLPISTMIWMHTSDRSHIFRPTQSVTNQHGANLLNNSNIPLSQHLSHMHRNESITRTVPSSSSSTLPSMNGGMNGDSMDYVPVITLEFHPSHAPSECYLNLSLSLRILLLFLFFILCLVYVWMDPCLLPWRLHCDWTP